MTTTPTQRATTVPPSPPSTPRVCLAAAHTDHAVLDGGWWPRSSDPAAELPGLILALNDRYGPIRQVMLNGTTWDNRFRRLAVGPGTIRIGWFNSLDPALAIATTDNGNQLDLLVVPPDTDETAARVAMARAADPSNTTRAPDILAAVLAAPGRTEVAAAAQDADQGSPRDNDGGHLRSGRPARRVRRRPAANSNGSTQP